MSAQTDAVLRKRLEDAASKIAAHRVSLRDLRSVLSDLGLVDAALARAVRALDDADTELELELESEG